jgi:hypothetical protein
LGQPLAFLAYLIRLKNLSIALLFTVGIFNIFNTTIFANDKKIDEIKQINKSEFDNDRFQKQLNLIIAHQFSNTNSVINKPLIVPDDPIWIMKIYDIYSKFDSILNTGDLSLLVSYIKSVGYNTDKKLFRNRLLVVLQAKLENGTLNKNIKELVQIFRLYKEFQKNHDLVVFCFNNTKDQAEQKYLKELIAKNLNYRKITKPLKKIVDETIDTPKILMAHLMAQFKFNNNNYLYKKLPGLVKRYQIKNDLVLKKLEALYINVLIQKQLYTRLINLLKKGSFFNSITPEHSLKIQAEMWIKKGFISNADKIIQSHKITAKIKNSLFLKIGNFFYASRKFIKSTIYYQKIDFQFIENRVESEVRWRIAYALMVKGHNQESSDLIAVFKWSESFNFEELEDAARFCFWNQYYFKSREGSDTLKCFKKYPNTYYGLHALMLNNKHQKKQYRLASQIYLSENDKILALIQLLDNLYINNKADLAEYIIRKFMYKNKHSVKFYAGFFKLLKNQRQYNLAISLIYYHFSSLAKIGENFIYRQLMQHEYPMAYHPIVNQFQEYHKLPKNIIHAVMREESKIRPEVKSSAGAIGLMQLMPRTAKYLNKFLKLKGPLDLTKPEMNIEIGAFYLNRLFKRYKGNLYHLLAAYNAGPTNANRWIKKQKNGDINFFLESISFSETRNYIKRVLKTRYIYQIIYET